MKSPPLLPRRSGAKRKETWYGTTGMVWTLDHNDLRTVWQDVSPEAGLTLRQAMLHYDGEKRAQEFCDLEAQGYGGDPPLLVGVDGWPTPPEVLSDFRVKSRWLREARERLEFRLVEKLIKGRLTATGYSSAARLDEPAQVIVGDRWRTLTPDFETSAATGSGMTISGILVFDKRSGPQPRTPQARVAQARVRAWYSRWVADNTAVGKRPSRDEDLAAARAALGAAVPRDLLRGLRRELAPESWRSSGRRSGGD